MPYFFDTYAIIEIIKSNTNYHPYSEEEIFTSFLNLGELYYVLLRNFDERIAEQWKKKLEGTYLTLTEDIIIKAMKFKFKHTDKHFSFIDCVGYILSRENNMTFLTGDKAFAHMENVEFVQ